MIFKFSCNSVTGYLFEANCSNSNIRSETTRFIKERCIHLNEYSYGSYTQNINMS